MEKPDNFLKDERNKLRLSLLPPHALLQVVAVLEHGAKKYSSDNWRACPEMMKYWDAAQRHLWSYRNGEINDPESGYPHLAHAAASILFILELEK